MKANGAKAQNRMKQYADRHRKERQFSIGEWVYLKPQPYRQVTVTGLRNKKLSPKFYGPYEVIKKIGASAYRLNLPEGSAIHPVFHVSQLKARIGDQQTTLPHLPVLGPSGSLQPMPIAILARRMVKKRKEAEPQILVQWANQTSNDATWESYKSMAQRFPDCILAVENSLKEGGM